MESLSVHVQPRARVLSIGTLYLYQWQPALGRHASLRQASILESVLDGSPDAVAYFSMLT